MKEFNIIYCFRMKSNKNFKKLGFLLHIYMQHQFFFFYFLKCYIMYGGFLKTLDKTFLVLYCNIYVMV